MIPPFLSSPVVFVFFFSFTSVSFFALTLSCTPSCFFSLLDGVTSEVSMTLITFKSSDRAAA